MHEVHAPHGAIHTWKDFLLHIATITIGLLIAIGLEQTVRYVHHLNQLQRAREELSLEAAENVQGAQRNQAQISEIDAKLARNMALLRAIQVSHAPLAKPLDYSWNFRRPRDGAWQTAKQSGTLDLMPHAELQNFAHLYAVMGSFMAVLAAQNLQLESATAIANRSPDRSLLPRDIEELITATSEAQAKTALLKRVLDFENRALQQVKRADR